jgi:fructose-specific phosphotransferase system IIC component
MSNIPPSMAAQPTAEVVPITTMILNTLVKDKAFFFNAIIAGLLIGYYLICESRS